MKDVDQLAGESTEMVQAHQAGNQLNNNFPLETTPTMHMTACEDHFVPVALSQHSVVVPPFDSSLSLMLHDSSLLSDLSLSLAHPLNAQLLRVLVALDCSYLVLAQILVLQQHLRTLLEEQISHITAFNLLR